VRLWHPGTGAAAGVLTGNTGVVTAIAISPNGQVLAGADRRTVRLWYPATGAAAGVLTGHTARVRAVAFSPDGRVLASAGSDETVRLWDPYRPSRKRQLPRVIDRLRGHRHTDPVTALAFSPDGRWLASGSSDGTVRLWDPVTGAADRTLTGPPEGVATVAFSADGRILASAGHGPTVWLWDATTGAPLGLLAGHTDHVRAVAFSPDGRWLASGGDDRTVRLWDFLSRAALNALGINSAVNDLAWGGDSIAVAGTGIQVHEIGLTHK
jgi:WD40 repeat protein